jgi:hypothetical protein
MLWFGTVLVVVLHLVLGRFFGPTAAALIVLIMILLLVAGQFAVAIREIKRSNRAVG